MSLYIAIDDTDNQESIGTGRLARNLADELLEQGYLQSPSVTRHQFLVHPDIPFTSHNSCACIGAEEFHADKRDIIDYAVQFLIRNFHEGADPGLCIVEEEMVSDEMVQFGQRAQREIIQPDEAKKLAERSGIFTWWLGEPWRGCIGAMGGVALRSTGNDGRFIGLEGIRDVGGTMKIESLLRLTRIDKVAAASGDAISKDDLVDCEWVRPSLRNRQAVLFVEPAGERIWRTIRDKKSKG